ncbi:MAG: hypothetical protein ABJM39_01200 [Porticoccus sp.]|uniref:hypothetical protein n=1 Tax=Porticoccus sp. TaxID=2024853 RepID=UPI000C104E88|nr:MAG: hypothetical protein COA29_05040 [Porticoccus sp.]|tara:strand:- start:522675 stop:522857 length:183 start_codon:yes stop_codon:yes gene_type:complete
MFSSRLVYQFRSRIRLAKYASHYQKNRKLFGCDAHPVTMGPEQLSRFFAFVANNERQQCR